MASTAKFLYVKQDPHTLSGPYIIHARKPHCILEMIKDPAYVYSGSPVASFAIIKEIEEITPEQKERIEKSADQWFFSVVSQKLIQP